MPLYAWKHLDSTAVVGLAFVLAMGFLLVVLSCALWANWLPLLVGEHRIASARRSERNTGLKAEA